MLLLLLGAAALPSFSQPLAFPDAEGCGRFASGGRGGRVIYVTNRNDSGPGSLREALTGYDEPRMILFSVSGTIYLESSIEVDKGNFTLAGQSAPGEGICIAGHGMDIEADQVIIRYMRFRPGDIGGDETDALTIKRSTQVMVDHCSMSWSTDETCSCYDNTHFTLQWCIVSESLDLSVHRKGEHGYGGIWGGMNASFHHNLLAHHTSRNPRLHGSRYHKHPELEKAEIVNNVVYNWEKKCIYAGEEGAYSITGNYFVPGPATKKSKAQEILEPWEPFSMYYFEQNTIEGYPQLTQNNYRAITEDHPLPDSCFLPARPDLSGLVPEPAEHAYRNVLLHAGASLYRDRIDQRIVLEVENKTFHFGTKGIINSQNETEGWPELKSEAAPADSDGDGMPDSWEKEHGFDPTNPADGASIDPSSGYSNLEIYLNTLCEVMSE